MLHRFLHPLFQFTKFISNLLIIDLNLEFPMTTPAKKDARLCLSFPHGYAVNEPGNIATGTEPSVPNGKL